MDFEKELQRGVKLLNEKKYKESIDIAKDLQYEEPDAPDGYRLEAMVMQKQNHWEQSIEALDKAIKNDPDDGGLYNLRGFAYLSLEKLSKAEKDLKKAIDLDNSPSAHRNLVLHKIMNDNGTEAIQYLIGRIKQNPQDVENWILMGDLMQRGGQTEKAVSYYEQAKKMDPENSYVKKQLDTLG